MAKIEGTAGDDNNLVGTIGNDNIYGYGGADILDGGDGNDNLYAGDGNDTLYGGEGNDNLDGGTGDDIMDGGNGNDTYTVDSAGDQVIEGAGGGYDTVKSSISYTLSVNLERLDLQGSADLSGTGNASDNTLKGNSGNNYLYGLDGNDGIDGGDGNDYIVGGQGNDTLVGGNGTDTVSYEDATNAVNVSLAITVSQVTGEGKDKITGFENLTGSNFDDHLTGDAGDNRIVGGLGIDVMAGGAGNDRYSVDNVGDVVTENSGEGVDQVLASVDWTLGANIENLTLFGSAIVGTGNALDNVIRGNDNGNTLNGKGGHDNLYGQAGSDTFVFDALDASSSDKVHDFQHGSDVIEVSGAAFGLTAGSIDSSEFVYGNAATQAFGQFIFDAYQNLYYDADGTGGGAKVLVATFSGATVDYSDIFVGP